MRLLFLVLFSFFSFQTLAAEHFEKALSSYENQKIDEAYIHLKNALQEDSENLPAKILMGKVLLQKGLYQDGIIEFQEALQLGGDPNLYIFELGKALMLTEQFNDVVKLCDDMQLSNENQLNCLLLKGNALVALEKSNDAIEVLEEAIILFPNNTRPYIAVASYYLQKRQLVKALENIERGIELSSNNSRAWHLKGEILTVQGKEKNALIAFERAYDLNANDPLLQRSLAQNYTNAGRYQEALILVEQIVEASPNDPFATLLHSQLLSRNNKDEEAVALLKEISDKLSLISDRKKNSNANLAFVSGTSAYLQGNLEAAQKDLTFYIKEMPNDLAGISMLVDIYLKSGQRDRVQDLLERKENLISTDLKLSIKLINIYFDSNNLYKAKKILEKLAVNYSDHPYYIMARANYLAKNKRYEEALAFLNGHKPLVFNGEYALTKGMIYLAQGDLASANQIADLLLKDDATSVNYLNFKGVLLLKEAQWEKAISIFEEILKTAPEHYSSLFNNATAYAALKNYEKAQELTKKLIAINDNDISVKILNAKLDRDTNNPQKAIDSLVKVLIVDAKNTTASETLLDLYIGQKNYLQALEEVDRLNKLSFLNPKYLRKKAQILVQLERYVQARQQLGILLGILEEPIELYQLSKLQVAAKDPSGALKSIELALSKQPNSLLFNLEFTKLNIQMGHLKVAEDKLNQLSKQFKNDPNVYFLQGQLLLKNNNLIGAQQKFMTALKQDNNFNAALISLYQLTLKGTGNSSFETELNRMLVSSPDNYLMRNLLADNLLNDKKFVKAQKHYEILNNVENVPNKAAILNNLANIYITSNLEKAADLSAKAVELNGNSAVILDTRGWVLALQGNYDEGLKHLRRSNAMNASDPATNYHIGYTLNKMGRTTDAVRELKIAAQSTVDFDEKEQAKMLLESLLN